MLDDNRYDEEVLRLAKVLGTVVRIAARTRQSVERDLDLSSGYLGKILGGTVDLRVRHILAISEAVGMNPADFFAIAYPPHEASEEQKLLIANVQAALHQRPAAPSATAEFDEEVRRALARLLGFESLSPTAR